MGWLYSNLTDELETGNKMTSNWASLVDFIATRSKINAIDRQLDWTNKV